MGGQLGGVSLQLKVQVVKTLLQGRYFLRLVKPLQNRCGQCVRGGCILQQFGHHEIVAQYVGQPHPGLQFLASHDLPGHPAHVVGDDHGAFKKGGLQGCRTAGYQRDITGGQRLYLPFPQAQIDALIPLVRDIVQRHQIRPERILGHGEVTPSYKEDPGPTFPWKLFADLGLTPPWPDAARVAAQRAVFETRLPDVAWFQLALARHGYAVEPTGVFDRQTERVLMNFQMRYRPADHGGRPDAESAALLWVLTQPADVRRRAFRFRS